MFVGVDVGGTKVLAAEVTEDGTVLNEARRSIRGVARSPSQVEDALDETLTEVGRGRRVTAVGVALAGLVDEAGARVRFSTHLPWRGDEVRDRWARRWGVPVVVENDANCAALAETAYGAARGVPSCLVVTVGTGIGGAVLLDGRLVRGANGMAGELGHQRVVPDGLECACGLAGCWEQYASGRALERLARERWGGSLVGPQVTEAALSGDPVAVEVFAEVGAWLGVGLANLVAVLDPARVVVGGGVSEVGDLLLAPARSALARATYAAAYRTLPPVVPATTGPRAGAVGAAVLARRQVG